jgi:hypothetical protein
MDSVPASARLVMPPYTCRGAARVWVCVCVGVGGWEWEGWRERARGCCLVLARTGCTPALQPGTAWPQRRCPSRMVRAQARGVPSASPARPELAAPQQQPPTCPRFMDAPLARSTMPTGSPLLVLKAYSTRSANSSALRLYTSSPAAGRRAGEGRALGAAAPGAAKPPVAWRLAGTARHRPPGGVMGGNLQVESQAPSPAAAAGAAGKRALHRPEPPHTHTHTSGGRRLRPAWQAGSAALAPCCQAGAAACAAAPAR